jgi:hypothetical protein
MDLFPRRFEGHLVRKATGLETVSPFCKSNSENTNSSEISEKSNARHTDTSSGPG